MLGSLVSAWIIVVAIGILPALCWNAYEIRKQRKAIEEIPSKDRVDRLLAMIEQLRSCYRATPPD